VARVGQRDFRPKVLLADPRNRPGLRLLEDRHQRRTSAGVALRRQAMLSVGDLVLGIVDPFNVGQTVTMGIVFGTARTPDSASDYQFLSRPMLCHQSGIAGGPWSPPTANWRPGHHPAIYSRTAAASASASPFPPTGPRRVVEGVEGGLKAARRPSVATGLGRLQRPGRHHRAIASTAGLAKPGGLLIKDI